MAKKTAAKKTASRKKRTPAQIRATKKLVAMNKKKRASKKKASARKKTSIRRATPRRRPTTRVRGYPGGARRTNPGNKWSGTHHTVKFVPRTGAKPLYVAGLNKEGTSLHFTDARNAAAFFALGSAQTILYLARRKAEESGWTGHMEIDSYHFKAWN